MDEKLLELLELMKLQDKVVGIIDEKVKLDHAAIKTLMERTDNFMNMAKELVDLLKIQAEQITLLQNKVSAMEKAE